MNIITTSKIYSYIIKFIIIYQFFILIYFRQSFFKNNNTNYSCDSYNDCIKKKFTMDLKYTLVLNRHALTHKRNIGFFLDTESKILGHSIKHQHQYFMENLALVTKISFLKSTLFGNMKFIQL